ncbi:hypothetical protein C0J52_00035 [Blattella germanica]|nr:hypothetical protein C0J52_00035 [Blattella germanica]
MSCFEGRLKELKNVSIDCFENKNLYSTTYFLSHCHIDHMQGLRSFAFLKRLKEEPVVFLYCSEITAHILKSEHTFKDVTHKIKDLHVGPENLVEIPDPDGSVEEVTVTLIPTGHCPGAVMFLVEGDTHIGRILYTGDFRIVEGDAPKFRQLHYSNGDVKTIDKLYLDTTFLSKDYEQFPNRQNSIALLCDLAAAWLKKAPDHHVSVELPARFGSEAVFMKLSNQLGMKVHVNDEIYNIYKNVTEIRDAVTNDPTCTRIHACLHITSRRAIQRNGDKVLLPCLRDWFKLQTLRPCALSFNSKIYRGTLESAVLRSDKENVIRVCYSCHSSYRELKYLVNYLNPRQIEACVVPLKMKEAHVLRLLRDMCDSENEPTLSISKRKVLVRSGMRIDGAVDVEEPVVNGLKAENSSAVEEAVKDTDAEIYRLIAEDFKPKDGAGNAEACKRLSSTFLAAAATAKRKKLTDA